MYRCFVYGTLRPGDYNHRRVGGTVGEAQHATAEGNIYHVSPGVRMFPVAKFDEPGTVIGDIVDFEDERWEHVVDMEVGAGYVPRMVVASHLRPDGNGGWEEDDGEKELVIAWHYAQVPRGRRITSGDWFNDDEEDVVDHEDDLDLEEA